MLFEAKAFWNEEFWLPRGVTWQQLRNTESKTYGQAQDLLLALPLTVFVFCLRMIVEKYIAQPIGEKLKLADKPHRPPSENVILEKVFKSITKRPTKDQLAGLSKQLDWSEKKVSAWFRKRELSGRPTTLQKFSETFWRFTFYISSFIYGIYVLHDEECLWNRPKCWADFPDNHTMSTKMYWYYMIEIAFYTSTTVTQFFDIKRKDFWEMFIHHNVTILLLVGSYIMNFTKMGSFIVLVHDSADYFLELAKMAKYAEQKQSTNVAFLSFTFAFLASRLTILPFWIITTIWSDALAMFVPFSVIHWLFPSLLTLQVLHFYWFWHVIRAAYASIVYGEIERDTRSDTEDEVADDEDENQNTYHKNKSSLGDGERNGVHKRLPKKN